jgi:transposase
MVWRGARDLSITGGSNCYCDQAGGFPQGYDGLAALAERELDLDPYSGIIVVFRAKRGDRIKVLLWDGSGLVLCHKRLEQGKFA